MQGFNWVFYNSCCDFIFWFNNLNENCHILKIMKIKYSDQYMQIVTAVKLRTDREFIPDDWISATYLKKCFERKNGKPTGYIQSFQEEHARFGKKKVCCYFSYLRC